MTTASRWAGGRDSGGRRYVNAEIVASSPGPGDELTTVTAVCDVNVRKGTVLRIRWDGAPWHIDANQDVPKGMQITMHVPTRTSKMAIAGHQSSTLTQALGQCAPLAKAAASDNWQKVKKLVKKGVDVDVVDHEGKTALSHACAAGNKEIVRLLLAAKADVDKIDGQTVTPLMRATVGNFTEIMEMVLDASADIDYTDCNDVSALMVGAGADAMDAVKLLIDRGCALDSVSVNKADSGEGMALSALMFAARQGKTEMVRQLVERGAKLDIESSTNGWTAFHMGCAAGQAEIVEILMRAGCETGQKDVLGRTGKDLAEEKDHQPVVERLRAVVVERMREQLLQRAGRAPEPAPAPAAAGDAQQEAKEEYAEQKVCFGCDKLTAVTCGYIKDTGPHKAGERVFCSACATQHDGAVRLRVQQGKPLEPEAPPGRFGWVTQGAHAVADDGRFGVVMGEPLSSGKVALRLPDGSETLYISTRKIREAVEEVDFCYRELNPTLSFGLRQLLTDKEAAAKDRAPSAEGAQKDQRYRPPELELLWRGEKRLLQLDKEARLMLPHTLPAAVPEEKRISFRMTGHTLDKYDGVYNLVGEHKGCPRFESVTGMQMYYFAQSFSWLLSPVFDPLTNKCDSFIAANSGKTPTVPFGRKEWKFGADGTKTIRTCWVVCAPCDSAEDPRPAPACPLLSTLDRELASPSYAFVVAKHPLPAYNGVYRTIETHEGFPRYENAQGKQLYRYIPGEMWCLNSEFQPRVNHCNSAIDSPLGDVPTGDQEWLVWRHGETGHRIHTLNLEAVSSPQEACKLWTANLEIWNEMTQQERKGVPADEPPTAEMAAGLRAMLAQQGVDVVEALPAAGDVAGRGAEGAEEREYSDYLVPDD